MNQRSAVIRRRALAVLCGFAGVTVLLAGRLVYLQVFQAATLSARAEAQRTKTIDLSASRGEIVDRNGKELAVSVDAYSIYAMPKEAKEGFKPQAVAAQLGPVLGLDTTELEGRLKGPNFRWLKRQADESVRDKVRALKIPGVGVVRESKRVYPNGELAATLLGFVGVDNQGLAGIENAFDKVLRGPNEKLHVQTDAYGHEILRGGTQAPAETYMAEGNRVVLTIDENLQHIAERELAKTMNDCDALRGTVLMMDPKTGNLLAFATVPTYDPNQYEKYNWSQIKNWPVTDVYEPGSTMKMFTVSAALEHHHITVDEKFQCPPWIKVEGRTISDHEAPKWDRELTPFEIMEQSSNVGATKIAFTMKTDEHRAFLSRMGFGRVTGSGITGESPGIMPPLPWRPLTQSTVSFGQGISVTPLQIIDAAAAIGNNGVRMRPRLIDKVVTSKGELVQAFPPHSEGQVLKPETTKQVMAMLEKVVESGTGTNAAVPGYKIGGKTGTAQKVSDDGRGYSSAVISSFLGFVPSNDPRFVMLTVLDRPLKAHFAAETAAPLFGRVAADALRYLGVQPTEPITSPNPKKEQPHEVL